jgi:2-polyprenyl-3-methyl-5-hydroxy-6-metoxy-1,4-benzoquinol methylase
MPSMHTPKSVPISPSLFSRSLQRTKRRVMVRAWEISGLLVTRYYSRLLRQHGHSPQALAERASDKDLEFYQHLFYGVDLPAQVSLLDIGCGMGDLIDFIQSRNVAVSSYLGIDLVKEFVDICRNEYLPPCRFQQANFVSKSFAPREQFDLVVNMGVLVSRVIGYEDYVAYCVEKMLALSTKHVLFNVIIDVDHSAGNYHSTDRIGHITYLPKHRLEQILAQATHDIAAEYYIHEVRIYPDATDAFVRITRTEY